MALASQVLTIPAAAGIDESTRPELLQPGQANRSARDVRAAKRGGLTKRRGFAAQALTRLDSDYGSRSAGCRLFAHGQQTCIIDGTYLDTWAPTDGNVTASEVPECGLSFKKLAATSLPTSSVLSTVGDCIVVGTRLVVATVAGGASSVSWATVYDYATGQVLVPPDSLAVGDEVVLGTYDNYALAFVANSGTIKLYYIDTTSAATLDAGWVAFGNVATDRTSRLSCTSLSGGVAFAYINNSGGASQVTVKVATIAGVTATQTVNTASATPSAVNVAGSTTHDTLWVVWNQAAVVKARGLNPANITLTALASTATVLTVAASSPSYVDIAAGSTAGTAYAIADTGPVSFCEVTTVAGTAVGGSQIDSSGAQAIGRPINIGGEYYVLMGFGQQKLAILCEFNNTSAYFRPVANAFPGLASTSGAYTAKIVQAGTKYVTPINVTRSSVAMSACLLEFDFADPTRWLPVAHGGVTYLTGGLLSYFDGERVLEAGFLMSPGQPSGTAGAAGSPNGDYRCVAVFESVDAAGNWVISGVSEPSDVVSVTGDQITWAVYPLNVSARPYEVLTGSDNRIRVAFYRTLAGGQAPYYRLGATENDPTSTSVAFADNVSDATLLTQPKLYAPSLPGVKGGAQDRRPFPSATHAVSYNGMLVGVVGEDVWWSGQDVSGEAAWTNPIFSQPVSGDGDNTGVACQDGTAFVFKRRAIYAMAGEPPSDNGGAGGLGAPRRLAVDVGCIDPRSIVVTSAGVFFQSERGIELLSRAQSVDWVGEKVIATLASYPYVVSAKLDASESVVYFELSSSSSLDSGSSVAVVFDLSLGVWISRDTRTSYAGSAGQRVTDGAVVWDGSAYRYAWLGADGRLNVEQDAYYDTGSGNTWLTPSWEPAFVKVGLNDEQRVYNAELLVERHSAAGLLIEQSYDYDDTYSSSDDKEWTEAETAGVRVFPWRPKPVSSAVGLQVSDSAPASFGTGQGLTFIGISVDFAAKRGPTTGLRHVDTGLRR